MDITWTECTIIMAAFFRVPCERHYQIIRDKMSQNLVNLKFNMNKCGGFNVWICQHNCIFNATLLHVTSYLEQCNPYNLILSKSRKKQCIIINPWTCITKILYWVTSDVLIYTCSWSRPFWPLLYGSIHYNDHKMSYILLEIHYECYWCFEKIKL